MPENGRQVWLAARLVDAALEVAEAGDRPAATWRDLVTLAMQYGGRAATKPTRAEFDRLAAMTVGEVFGTADLAVPVVSQCECGGLARHAATCRWRKGYGSSVVSEIGPRIGDRGCDNCGSAMWEHCAVHLIPCCPGKCPGLSRAEQARQPGLTMHERRDR